ncbi:CpsD/CapB family tyrosine-protein kinase [Ammoniphilus sp. CFH 90114]|uniref:CpsD/CapB family tyrosine-protein kinase n=1 Tax=Ammoniphilus sp. CFH 90114 TaxID=2493665 RepID=UPI00100DCC2B|nr:CpsD/CapB family tyrosine-protein kinase [Ammoniphilus sp. CFH 90114]RXT03684.1 polysaccharide biosynthesis tyrosine autokinase [Ammoniphilus sp. CFH 90114]
MFKKKPLQSQKRNLITMEKPKSPISEAYKTLRTNIQFAGIDRELKTIMVTSTGPSEGKSTTVANLAVVMAQSEKRTLLIDADLRKPTVHHTFDLANRQGLTTYLAGQDRLEDVIQATEAPNLDVMSSGPIPPNPAEMLNSKVMTRLLEELSVQYDQILIDTPPLIAVADAQILASKVDGVILVVNSGMTNREIAVKAKQQLENAKANILGVVLNNKQIKGDSYYYYYYGAKK